MRDYLGIVGNIDTKQGIQVKYFTNIRPLKLNELQDFIEPYCYYTADR